MAATTRNPPAPTDQPRGSPEAQAKTAPKTGSRASTTEVTAADRRAWAQLWTTKANAVAATAVTATAAHSPLVPGNCRPSGDCTAEHTIPTASSCTVARPYASRRPAHRSRPTICRANRAADTTVRSSPVPMATPRRLIAAKPDVASRLADHVRRPGRRLKRIHPRSGVKTTCSPVRNPDTAAGVCSRP